MTENITLPREVVKFVLQHLEWWSDDEPQEKEAIAALRAALSAPKQEHPGYVIGSHWLETAYSRICAGEAEADVLRDIGLARITDGMVETADIHAIVDRQEALRRQNERLREALELAFSCHGKVLMSDPPQDAWKFHRVNEVIAAALRREAA